MKSIFTKLSTLLLFGAVAMVGCTDFSEDIQAVDKKVDGLTTELNSYKTTTATTIAELQASISALKATQEQMAADYAKKTELQDAKTELQELLSAEIAKVDSEIKKAVADISALQEGKADKTAVAELEETVNAAIEKANKAIETLDAAKADKTQVDEIDNKVATLIDGYQQMVLQFQNLALVVEGKAEQADLELVEKDVETLKNGYQETVAALQNISATLETKADQADLELAQKDIEALKKSAAEAVFAITNLNASVEALDARVEALESEMEKVKTEIAQHTATLQNLLTRLETAEGDLEDEAAAREAADKELQAAAALLEMGLTNLQTAYNIHIEEFEAYKNNMAKQIEALGLEDALIYKTIQDNFITLSISVEETAAALREERDAAIKALEDKIVEEWEKERALIYNTIADIQKTLFAAIEEGDALNADQIAALDEAYQLADALIYKTIDSYREILEIAMIEGDAAVTEAMEAADALIYKTIDDIQKTLFAAIEEGDAAVLETVAADLEDKLALVYNTIEDIKMTLFAAIEEGDAAVAETAQKALDDAVALIYKTIGSTKEDLQAEIAQTKNDIVEVIDDAVALIYKTIENTKKDLQAEIQDLRNELDERIAALTGRVSKLEIDVDALEKALADLETALENGLAETLELAFKNDEGVMGNVKAFEDKVSALVEELRNADGKIREDFAAELAAIITSISEIKSELEDNAEWQESMTTVTEQLNKAIADLWDAIDLLGTTLQKNIDDAVANLTAEDAKIRAEIEAGLAEMLRLAILNDSGVMDNVRAFEEKMANIVTALQSQINDLLARVQSIVLVPEYNDGKATIHFASLDGYPIIGPSVLKYRVQAVKGEDAASITEAIENAWKNNPEALKYHVVPVKERTRNAQPEATLNIEDVTAEKDFIYVTVRPADFDGAFYTSVMKQNSNIEALVDELFSRTTSYSAAIIFTDGVNNVTSEYYNLYPEATEVTMKIVIPDEEGTVKDITNVLPGEERQKLAYTDVETSKAILAGHDLLFTVNGEDYTKDALVKEFGYDINIRHITVLSYTGKGFEDNVDTINLNYGVTGNNYAVVYGNDEDVNFVIYPGKDCTVKLAEPLAKEQVGNVLTLSYEYTVNDAVSVQTSSEVEITHEIVNVTFEEVTIPWSLKLANELRGVNKAGEDVPYINTYIEKAVAHDCQYDLGTMLKSISADDKLEKTIKVNGEVVSKDRVVLENYDDAKHLADIKFTKGSPKFNAEGPTKYEIVYHGIYNNQYDVTATAIVVFEQIPSFEITSDVTLASQKGWFVGDDPLVKDGILDKTLAADLGYETAADALNQLYAAYTDAASTKETEITFGGKTIKGSRGNGNVQLNVTENHDLTKVYLYNGDVEELLGNAELEDDSVFTIKHTITTWTGAKVVYTINAKTDLPDYVLSTDPVRVQNDIVEVKGEIVNNEYTVDVADLAKYYYIFNEGLETLVAPKTNVPELEVEFTLAGQNKAEGFYIKDNVYNFPVKFENKGLLDMNTAVVNWGTYPYTEIVVNATLKANGYPIDSKPITLVTKDPLHILFEDVDVTVDHKAGTNDEPVVAKVYHNFNITSDVEPEAGNLCNIDAKTIAGLFWHSHADKTYGIEVETEVLQVYYEENGVRKNWDREKYTIGYRVDEQGEYILDKNGEKIFDGNIYINADDAGILVPIKAEVGVRVSHRIHAASPVCVNEGTITVTFNPAK